MRQVPSGSTQVLGSRRWEVYVDGIDAPGLRAATGGTLLIGTEDEPFLVRVEDRKGTAVLVAASPDDDLEELTGPVRMWWPDPPRGRCEVDARVARGPRDSTVRVTWSPRNVQQRRHVRARLSTAVWVSGLFDTGSATGHVLDLSAGGLAVSLPREPSWWEEGARVAVCVLLPDGPLVAAATVVRISPRGQVSGLRFDTISAADEDRIAAAAIAADTRRAVR